MAVAANQNTLLGGTLNGNYKDINELNSDVRSIVQNFDGLVLIRESTPGSKRTTGTLWYKGQVLLFTVEDIIRKTKIAAKTAIPDNIKDPTKTETFGKGSYYVTLDITAVEGLKRNYVKFPDDKRSKFKNPGVFPRVGTNTSATSLNFDGISFGGIRIHDGTSEQSSAGCIIVSRTRKSDGTLKYDLPASFALTRFIYNELGLKSKAYTRIIIINEFELPQPTINDIIKSEGTVVNSNSSNPIKGVTVTITNSPLQPDNTSPESDNLSPEQEGDTEFTSIESLFQQPTSPSGDTSLPTFKVNSAYLKIKKEPKNSSETLETLLLQNEVEMLNGNFVKENRNTWVNVRSLKSKNTGWVLSKFLNPLPTPPDNVTFTPGTNSSNAISPITTPVSPPIEPISNDQGNFSIFIPPSDITDPEDISESAPTSPPIAPEELPKVTISAPGYETKEIIPYRGDGTQKSNLGVVELTPLKTSLDNDITNISQLNYKQIEELSKSRKDFKYFAQKRLTELIINLKGKAIPLVLSSISAFGITKANELISQQTIKLKNKSYCPPQSVLDTLISKKNKLVKQLNNSIKIINSTTTALGISSGIIISLQTTLTASSSIPTPVPASVPLALQRLTTLISGLKSANAGILAVLILLRQTLTELVQYLSILDQLIQQCYPNVNQEQLSVELTALTLQQTQQESPIVTNVNGFEMGVETEPTTNSLKRRRAIARNKQGVVMLKGEWSFSSIDQILIDELVFYIQQNDLKAE